MIRGAIRLLLGAVPAAYMTAGILAPELPRIAAGAGILIFGVALWRPAYALVVVAALAPAGQLLAPTPVAVAELLAWACVAGWLLAVWRPIIETPLPRTVSIAAMLYAAAILVSWLGVLIRSASGVAPMALGAFVLRSIPANYFASSSPDAATWNFLPALASIALFVAAATMSRANPHIAGWVARALVASTAILAALTAAEVLRQWADVGFGMWYLIRYTRGERFSLHLADLNAAGSLYVLGGLTAAALAAQPHPAMAGVSGRGVAGRWVWLGAAFMMLPALWLSGSRTAALGAVTIGALILASTRFQRRLTKKQLVVAGLAIGVLAVAAMLTAATGNDEQGTASKSVRLRLQFMQTSARMLASSPLFGVGIGQYLPRSSQFMPDELRSIYPAENAHNYFIQQFAELGVAGGVLFVGLVTLGLVHGWRAAPRAAAVTGLLAGIAGYLLTCVTGHPLLVPETALPFWIGFGVVAGAGASVSRSPTLQQAQGHPRPSRRMTGVRDALRRDAKRSLVVGCVAVLLVTSLASSVASYLRPVGRPDAKPVDRGFHEEQTAPDGTRFRWSTRHAVTWVSPQVGFLAVPLRAPDFLQRARPFVVQLEVDGRAMAKTEVPSDAWVRVTLGLREPASGAFRRVDLRVNQWWTTKRNRNPRDSDDRPMGVMVGEIRLEPLRR